MLRSPALAAALLAGSALATSNATYNVTDPIVFDHIFYLSRNSDLFDADLFTVAELKAHWESDGIDENRVGSGPWRASAYLARYDDLEATYGGGSPNYAGLVDHWFQYGDDENREGYVEGGSENRYTVSADHRLYVSSSDLAAGAIDSLVFDGVEYLVSWDPTSVLSVWVIDSSADCDYTSAGANNDLYTNTYQNRSQVDFEVTAAGSQLLSAAELITFERCGDAADDDADDDDVAGVASGILLDATADLSVDSDDDYGRVDLTYEISFPDAGIDDVALRVPVIPAQKYFTEDYALDGSTILTEVSTGGFPIILATEDSSAAIGMIISMPDGGTAIEYDTVSWAFSAATDIVNPMLFRPMIYHDAVAAGDTVTVEATVCVGDLDAVVTCMTETDVLSGAPPAAGSVGLGAAALVLAAAWRGW